MAKPHANLQRPAKVHKMETAAYKKTEHPRTQKPYVQEREATPADKQE